MNITLIGMPGAGKSFVGEKLARAIGFRFVTPDKLLEHAHGVPLQQVLEKLGNEKFLDAEADVVIAHTTGKDALIISPGGSMIYRSRAMEHLKRISAIVYLETPFPVIEKRVGKVPRGIVGLDNKTFEQLYAERIPLYEQWATLTVAGDQHPEEIISEITARLNVSAVAR